MEGGEGGVGGRVGSDGKDGVFGRRGGEMEGDGDGLDVYCCAIASLYSPFPSSCADRLCCTDLDTDPDRV